MIKPLVLLCVSLSVLACKGAPAAEEASAPKPQEKSVPNEVTLTPEGVAEAKLAFASAERRPLAAELSVPAHLTFTQNGVAKIAARVPGRLVDLDVKLGQKVERNGLLCHIESPELAKARAEYLAAATRARVTQLTYQREKSLGEKGISSEREVREAESAYVSAEADRNAAEAGLHALGLNEAEIRALKADEHYSARFPARSPIAGTVVEVSATIGQSVEATTPLFTVGDLSELWAQLDIFESQLGQVRVGQKVTLTVGAYPDQRFEGQIAYVGDVVDEKTRAVSVRVVVPNKEGRLKPGMFGTATIAAGGGAQETAAAGVIIPKDAVQNVGDQDVVFEPVDATRFRAVKVKLGRTTPTEVEVLDGVAPGTKVVSKGAFLLKSELSKAGWGDDE
jgi:cobalt-zinc-cadmium efflux system membrane fusion protein